MILGDWPPPVDPERNKGWWDSFWEKNVTDGFGAPSASLLRFLPEAAGVLKAVDIASGNGRYALTLAQLGYLTTAVELTTKGIQHIQARASALGYRIDLRVADFIDISEEQHDFDLVFCSGLFEEIPSEQFPQVIKGFENWVSPRGLVIHRYCLQIEGRGVLIPDGWVPGLYKPARWDILYCEEMSHPKMSKGGFNLRHGTVVSRLKGV